MSAHPGYVYVLENNDDNEDVDDDDYVDIFYSRDLCESMQPANHMKKRSIFLLMPCLCVALIHRQEEEEEKDMNEKSYTFKTILISIDQRV